MKAAGDRQSGNDDPALFGGRNGILQTRTIDVSK